MRIFVVCLPIKLKLKDQGLGADPHLNKAFGYYKKAAHRHTEAQFN